VANKPSRRQPEAGAALWKRDHVSGDATKRRPELVPAPARAPARVPALAVLALLLVVSLVPRLATLQRVTMPSGEVVYRHFEGDERVFGELVQRVKANLFDYSLHGSPLLGELNPSDYDLPIFFHPPAFVYTARLLSFLPLPLLPVLMNLATIAIVFFLGRRCYDEERALWAALLAAVCPIMWFMSQKIWLDNMLVMMVAASMAVTAYAADRGRVSSYALAGATFGLAFLTKVAAVLILPALALLALQRDREGLGAAKAAAFVLPAVLLAGWWELTLKAYNGVWSPSAFPDAGVLARVPFTAEIVARPWYFYLVNVVAISPIYLLAAGAVARRRAGELPIAVWVLAFWIGATAFGLRGGGYQSRYLAPAYPALALLAAEPIPSFRAGGLAAVVALAGYGMVNAFIFAVNETPHVADFQFSAATILIEKITLIGTFGQ
jgi:hypothetical protein